ncbi:hypothetical protein [Rhodococcus sp. NCIMB 12038]|uniref:hypothetical protein n=1 Tax=Rhodococcus sp. NCIMB 12038 TaxID=933800 RepID=UPI000B3C3ACA|nr:hypothetical protein [Rhodococcus sp. NCIMB 12038]OUS96469.1 hypothetical protein CA951_06940 [Rhodococcus sp. NCIMB 12038]
MVLDEVWRELDGVEPLSGPDGGPLSRTVKLILDPLVIRPVQNPLCAGPIVTADGAQLLATRVHASADVLRATAAWFTLLKRVRRALRITDGNPQDLYFQRCFELATGSGAPDPLRDEAVAENTLRDVHDVAAGRTTQALKAHVTDPARARELSALIDLAWGRRPLSGTVTGDHAAAVAVVLDACPGARLEQDGDDGRHALDDLVAGHAGTHHGIALWTSTPEVTAHRLGLTSHPVPVPPRLGSSASTSALGLPFDRSVHERVFTVLRASTDRAELPPIHELVTTEIARSCSPWALLDETLRVVATTGAALATGLHPIGTAPSPSDTDTTAVRVINGRWQREAYVLQARRLTVNADAATLPDTNPLAAIAAELREPWRPYLRRLWVRLHGRDVREFSVHEPGELWDLLDGVARSVILDHRLRVKQALSAIPLADATDAPESRAS